MPEILVKTILTTTIIFDSCLFIFLFQKQRHEIFFTFLHIYLFGILGWSVSILMLLLHTNDFWAQCAFATPIILACAKLFFVLSFPENRLPKILSFRYIFIFPAIIVFVFTFIKGLFFYDVAVVESYYIVAKNGPYALLYSAFITSMLFYAIILLLQKYRCAEPESLLKEQLKYLLYGTIAFFVVGLLANSILPVFFNIYFFNGLGPSFSLILVSFIVYIISRHHFLEIRTALQRSFIFSLLAIGIIAFYISLVTALGLFVQQLTQFAVVASGGVTTLVGIFTVPYVDQFLRKKTDRFFFKNHYNYAEALYTLSEQVNSVVSVDDIKQICIATLQDIFKAHVDFCSIKDECYTVLEDIKQEKSGQEKFETLLVPIILGHSHIGTIILGEKQSGDVYTNEDMVLMKTFSHHIAVAFEKARLLKEVQEYSLELEERVAERTAQIETMQENQTQMMLDISHKLQSPLTIIKSEIGLLRKVASLTDSLSFFEKTIDDTSAFIYDLLHLARLGNIQDISSKDDVDLSALMCDFVEYFEIVAQHENIHLLSSIESGIRLKCHVEKINELVTNLVSNAVKYIGSKEKKRCEIHITLKADKNDAVFIISDNGIGMHEDDLPHIFERFYRTGDIVQSSVHGTGLGLTICKKIVDIHDGSIVVESEEGVGTIFTIRLPRIYTPTTL